MKGKIIIECIQQDEVDAVAAAEGWDLEKGKATGLSINIGMAATRPEVVEVCYSLCAAFELDPMEKMMLALKLAGAMPGGGAGAITGSPGRGTDSRPSPAATPPPALMIRRKEAFDHVR